MPYTIDVNHLTGLLQNDQVIRRQQQAKVEWYQHPHILQRKGSNSWDWSASKHSHCFKVFCILACKYVCKTASIEKLISVSVLCMLCAGKGQLHRSDHADVSIGSLSFYQYATFLHSIPYLSVLA